MKKFLLLIPTCLCLLGLVACGSDSTSTKKTGSGGNDDTTKNGGSSSGGIIDYTKDQALAKLEELRSSTGYYITYQITTTGDGEDEDDSYSITVASKGDFYYLKEEDGDEIYYDLSDSTKAISYEKSPSDENFYKDELQYNEYLTKDMMKQQFQVINSWVGFYSGFMTSYDTVSNETFLGRSCKKYSQKQSATTTAGTIKVTYYCYIDKDTGACLKWYAEGEGTSTESGKFGGSVTFECTEFKTSYDLKMPTNIATEE